MASPGTNRSTAIPPPGGGDQGGVGLTDSLGPPGRPRGVEHHGHIVCAAEGQFGLEEPGMVAIILSADCKKLVEIVQTGLVVVEQPSWIVENNMCQSGKNLAHVEKLVDLPWFSATTRPTSASSRT